MYVYYTKIYIKESCELSVYARARARTCVCVFNRLNLFCNNFQYKHIFSINKLYAAVLYSIHTSSPRSFDITNQDSR